MYWSQSIFTSQLILTDTGSNGLEQLNSSILKLIMLGGARIKVRTAMCDTCVVYKTSLTIQFLPSAGIVIVPDASLS